MRNVSLPLAVALAGGLALAAAPASGGNATVKVKDYRFAAKTLHVGVGTKVTWKFVGAAEHTVTFRKFHSKGMSSGTYSHRFTKKGTYKYICIYHVHSNGMRGTIVVS